MIYIIEVEDHPFVRRSLTNGEEYLYRIKGTGITLTEGLLSNFTKMPLDREEAMLVGQDMAWSLAQNILKDLTTNAKWKEAFGGNFDEKPLLTIRFEEARDQYKKWSEKV